MSRYAILNSSSIAGVSGSSNTVNSINIDDNDYLYNQGKQYPTYQYQSKYYNNRNNNRNNKNKKIMEHNQNSRILRDSIIEKYQIGYKNDINNIKNMKIKKENEYGNNSERFVLI